MTTEQKSISRKNHKKAEKELNLQKGYVLHHKDHKLKDTDIERYIEWNVEDLVVMTKSEHIGLHNHLLGESRFKGHRHTDKTKAVMREKAIVHNTGRHWYTDGETCKYCYECPEGFHEGRFIKK